MKIIITGHTRGIGKGLYDYFVGEGHEVIGLSRSNGYDISKNQDKIVEISSDCDLFINNAYQGNCQLQLLLALKNKVKNIIVCGSVSRMYAHILESDYAKDKQNLAEACRIISIKPDGPNLLHLDMSFITDSLNENIHSMSDYCINYNEIISAVVFWLSNPKVRQIEFCWKLTAKVYNKMKQNNSNHLEIDKLTKIINTI